MTFKDVLEVAVRGDSFLEDNPNPFLKFFKTPYKKIEVQPFVYCPSYNTTLAGGNRYLINDGPGPTTEQPWAVKVNTVRDFFYGDYQFSITYTYGTTPFRVTIYEDFYNFRNSANNSIAVIDHYVTATDNVNRIFEAKDRLFSDLRIIDNFVDGSMQCYYKFVGFKIRLI